jgi:hypothetical protein
VENKHFISMLGAVGVRAPSEKQLRTTMLDKAYAAAKADVAIKMADSRGAFQLITDGWRNKHCGDGAQLVTLVTTLPSGGAVFHKVWHASKHNCVTNQAVGSS